MITAIDSSVLWSLIKQENDWKGWEQLLVNAATEGPIVVCPVVFAEMASAARDEAALSRFLSGLQIGYNPFSRGAAFLAGDTFRAYRLAGGPYEHLVPDFLIAAHALVQADRLAAIDRGYLRKWFPSLVVLKPATP